MNDNKFKDILEAYSPSRENLVSVLQDIQEKEGFISQDALEAAAEYFSISKADVYSVASFYAQFKFVNAKLNEPFALINFAVEYTQGGNHK